MSKYWAGDVHEDLKRAREFQINWDFQIALYRYLIVIVSFYIIINSTDKDLSKMKTVLLD